MLDQGDVKRATRLYGLVYPVDRWWMRLSVRVIRGVSRVFGQPAPFAVHPDAAVDARIRAAARGMVGERDRPETI